MEQLPQELREERAARIMEIQAGIMARRQEEKVGAGLTVICDGLDDESGLYACRSMGDAPEIDALRRERDRLRQRNSRLCRKYGLASRRERGRTV